MIISKDRCNQVVTSMYGLNISTPCLNQKQTYLGATHNCKCLQNSNNNENLTDWLILYSHKLVLRHKIYQFSAQRVTWQCDDEGQIGTLTLNYVNVYRIL